MKIAPILKEIEQGGTLTGTGEVLVPTGGTLTWTGGWQTGSGETVVEAGADLDGLRGAIDLDAGFAELGGAMAGAPGAKEPPAADAEETELPREGP